MAAVPSHEQIAGLLKVVDVTKPDHDMVHSVLTAAEKATNGSSDPIQDLRELTGSLTFFLMREKLNEPQRHAQLVTQMARSCPVRQAYDRHELGALAHAGQHGAAAAPAAAAPAAQEENARPVLSAGWLKFYSWQAVLVVGAVLGVVTLMLANQYLARRERAALERDIAQVMSVVSNRLGRVSAGP
jgi:hypothetical protein